MASGLDTVVDFGPNMRHCFLALQVVILPSQSVEISFWPAVTLFISFIKRQARRMLTCISVWLETRTRSDCQITLTFIESHGLSHLYADDTQVYGSCPAAVDALSV